MKKSSFLFVFLFSLIYGATAQEIRNDNSKIMSSEAFNRLIRSDISYAVLGDKSPTQGVKIDVTDPKLCITASIFSRRKHFLSSDFEGKINDGKFTLFEKNKFNSIFSLGFNYCIILNKNAYRWTANKAEKELAMLRVAEERKGKKTNTKEKEYMQMLILAKTAINPKDSTLISGRQSDAKGIFEEEEEINHAEALALSAKYFKIDPAINNFYAFLAKVKNDTTLACNLAKLLDDYRGIDKQNNKSEEALLDFEIDMMKGFWRSKKLYWFSLYSNISYQKYMTYNSSFANLQANHVATGNILLGHFNAHVLAPDFALYFKTGGGLAIGNNLSDFKRRDYTKIDTLESLPGSIYIEETKGVAYFTAGETIKFFPQLKLDAEFYFMPSRKGSFMPGIFMKMGCNLGKTLQMPAEIGLLFNVQSKVKDRNFFSILPFIGFDNLLDIDSDTAYNGIKNWKFSIKVGLPIQVRMEK